MINEFSATGAKASGSRRPKRLNGRKLAPPRILTFNVYTRKGEFYESTSRSPVDQVNADSYESALDAAVLKTGTPRQHLILTTVRG